MKNAPSFYNRYHLKNKKFVKLISKDNFTYVYIIGFLHLACMEGFWSKKVLDVGCGVGTVALYLSSLGANVKGVDISSRAIKIANAAKKELKLKTIEFSKGEITKGNKKFDFVISFEVIEHVPDEKEFLKRIRSNLKKSGLLVLSTPSKENLLYKMGFYKNFDKEVGHLRRYTQTSLKNVLMSNGFEVINFRNVEGPLRNILFTTKLGFLIRFIKGPLVPIFHFFDNLSGLLFGYSDMQVIAKKTNS